MLQLKLIGKLCLYFFFLVEGVASTRKSANQDPDRLRFTFVDLGLVFYSLPSLLPNNQVQDVVLATKVFLENALNVDPPTTINEMYINLISQSSIGEGYTAVIGKEENVTTTTTFVVSTDLQILIKYQLVAAADTVQNDMDQRIRTILTEEWGELQKLIRVLDPVFFGSLHILELKPKLEGFQSQSTMIYDGGANKTSQLQPQSPSTTVVIILLVIALCVGLLLLTISPLIYFKSEDRYVEMALVQCAFFKSMLIMILIAFFSSVKLSNIEGRLVNNTDGIIRCQHHHNRTLHLFLLLLQRRLRYFLIVRRSHARLILLITTTQKDSSNEYIQMIR